MLNAKYKIADCHCDTISLLGEKDYDFGSLNTRGHIDLPRLQKGGIALQFFAICTAAGREGNHLQSALAQVGRYHRTLAENSAHLVSLESAGDLRAAERDNKIATLLSLEGAEPLEGSAELTAIFHRLGMRALSLTWNHRNLYADGAGVGDAGGGLTPAGKALVRELSRRRIILDLAHLSARCFFEALELAGLPPLVSHANARRLCDHPRNLTDEQLKALAAVDGVMGLSLYPQFISAGSVAELSALLDHFVHAADLIGVEHLAFGSDFDGIDCTVEGIKDASEYGALPEALGERGFLPEEIELIARGNIKRIVHQNLGGELK
jgi:membrane dipeptidase